MSDYKEDPFDDGAYELPYRFSPSLAADVGLNEAILISDFQWRLKINEAPVNVGAGVSPGFHYTSVKIRQIFPFWSDDEFRRVVYSLVDQHIMDYASREPNGLTVWFNDHAAWGGPVVARPSQPAPVSTTPPPVSIAPHAGPHRPFARHGYVYVLKSQDGLYKIGKSISPTVRIRSLGVVLPFSIEPIHLIESDDYTVAESILHRKFAASRVRGEWFSLSGADLEWLLSLTSL